MDWGDWRLWVLLFLAWVVIDFVGRLPVVRACLGFFEKMPALYIRLGQPDEFAEQVEFPTSHGLVLRGALYRQTHRPSRGVVVFCHEYGGNRWMAFQYCEAVWNAGFDVFAFDFRNHGDSDALPGYSPTYWLTEYEVLDLQAALTYVRSRPDLADLPVSLFGVSRGGGAALAVAAGDPNLRCVLCDSSFTIEEMMVQYTLRWAHLVVPRWTIPLVPRWHLRGTMALVRYFSQRRRNCRFVVLRPFLRRLRGRPVYVIAGDRDTYVPTPVALEMHRNLGGDGGTATLWLIPKANHNAGRKLVRAEYDRRVTEFFLTWATDDRRPQEAPVPTPAALATSTGLDVPETETESVT